MASLPPCVDTRNLLKAFREMGKTHGIDDQDIEMANTRSDQLVEARRMLAMCGDIKVAFFEIASWSWFCLALFQPGSGKSHLAETTSSSLGLACR